MICTYLNLDPSTFFYNRSNGEPSIVEFYDPIQFMIPNPKNSRVIGTISKERSVEILSQIVQASAQKLRDNQELIRMRKS